MSGSLQVTGNGDVSIIFNATSTPKFLVAIIPNSYPTKTGWYVSEINKGTIGTSLFELPVLVDNLDSQEGRWNDQDFKFYISSFATTTNNGEPMKLQN